MPSTSSAAFAIIDAAKQVWMSPEAFLPEEVRYYFSSKLKDNLVSLDKQLSSLSILHIRELLQNGNQNEIFEAANHYVKSWVKGIKFNIINEEIEVADITDEVGVVDIYNGVHVTWRLIVENDVKLYQLTFEKKHVDKVIHYISQILKEYKEEMEIKGKKTLRYHTLAPGMFTKVWQSVDLDDPATFDSLAMDLRTKIRIMGDLDNFVEGKECERKASIRRFFLFVGTLNFLADKLIQAMARHIKFNLYELGLNGEMGIMDLLQVLSLIQNKSILVVPNTPVYEGVLDILDELWSSCEDEKRIVVFTSIHKQTVDVALLDRMDVHLHLVYFAPLIFKNLASNYSGNEEPDHFNKIDELLKITKLTLADITGHLVQNGGVKKLIQFLENPGEDVIRSIVKARRIAVAKPEEGTDTVAVEENGEGTDTVAVEEKREEAATVVIVGLG